MRDRKKQGEVKGESEMTGRIRKRERERGNYCEGKERGNRREEERGVRKVERLGGRRGECWKYGNEKSGRRNFR